MLVRVELQNAQHSRMCSPRANAAQDSRSALLRLWLCCAARYRGVVYGWDRRCERSSAWAASNRVAPDQPFYFCLPDEGESIVAWPSC